MNSSSDGIGSALAKSVTNMTAPLSTQISSGGVSRSWSAATAARQLGDLRLQRGGRDQHRGQLAGVAVLGARDPSVGAVGTASALVTWVGQHDQPAVSADARRRSASTAQYQSRLSPGRLGRAAARSPRACHCAPALPRRRGGSRSATAGVVIGPVGASRSTGPTRIDVEAARQPHLARTRRGSASCASSRLRWSKVSGPAPPAVAQLRSTRLDGPRPVLGERTRRPATRRRRVGPRRARLAAMLVERVQVLGHQLRGPGERGPHAAAEHLLQQRQHLAPQPRPG